MADDESPAKPERGPTMPQLMSIGEFSRATALTVKTLRLYHARGLLKPRHIDPDTSYRYYDLGNLERAQAISFLRQLKLPLHSIAEIVRECEDDADALDLLESQRAHIAEKLRELSEVQLALDTIINRERRAQELAQRGEYEVETHTTKVQLVAALRCHGSFDLAGQGFRRLGRHFGFQMAGKPGMLVYDQEFKPDDASFEVFFPIRKQKSAIEGIEQRELASQDYLSVIHHGPYDECPRSYARIFAQFARQGLRPATPSRESYIKGPGMIFRGNPAKYLTRILVPIGQ